MDQANNQQPMSTPQLPPIPNFGGRKKTKFPILFLIGGISVLVVSILAAIFFIPKLQTNETSNGHVACTADAMICPDG